MQRIRPKSSTKRQKPEPKISSHADETDDRGVCVVINPDWRLQYDGLQFQVQRRRVNKRTNTEVWVTKAYVTHLDNAVVWLARNRVYTVPGQYDIEALEKLCSTLDEIKAECKAAVEALVHKVPAASVSRDVELINKVVQQ